MSSEQPDADSAQEKQALPEAVSGYGTPGLRAYLQKYHGKFTDEALTASLLKAGYSADAVRDGFAYVAEREASAPVRARARWAVIGLYLVSYIVLVVGMFVTGSEPGQEFGQIVAFYGSGILAVALGIALLIAIGWVGSTRIGRWDASAAFGVFAVPLVLWVVVAGSCVLTGLPFGWVGSTGP